jgi:hypothetical protein
MKNDSGRNENFFGKFWLDFAVDVKSSMVEQNQKSTVTTNCHAILSPQPSTISAPFIFFGAGATAAMVVTVSFFFILCHTHRQEVLVAG